MKGIPIVAGLAVALVLGSAAEVLAHGPLIAGPPSVSVPSANGSSTTTAGGNSTPNSPAPSAPQGLGTPGYNGPGGQATPSLPGGGPNPVRPLPPAPDAPAGGDDSMGGTTPGIKPVGTSPVGPAPRGGRTASARGKASAAPWLSKVRVPWQAGFLPAMQTKGYDAETLGITEALTREPADGGWLREDRPTIVLTYDPVDKDSMRALETLERDARFVAAAQLFNCFRVDLKSIPGAADRTGLMVFDRQGKALGSIAGDRRLSGAYPLLRVAFKSQTGKDLDKELPTVQKAVNALAQVEWSLDQLFGQLTSANSAHTRSEVVKRISEAQTRKQDWKKELEGLRKLSD